MRVKDILIHIFLFVTTVITTTIAGAEWMQGRSFFGILDDDSTLTWFSWDLILQGLYFSVPFISILTLHEFGHYFMAVYYKVRVTLPYYIPMLLGLGASIGTMGAFIRIKSPIATNRQFFDIGIAGPLTGFVAALGVLIYGYTHLPPPEHIFTIHPEYQQYGLDYANFVYQDLKGTLRLDKNLLMVILEHIFVDDLRNMPNSYEMMHYPFLFAGYLACFFTALNLLPIGQLDGGHILYGLVGEKWHKYISVSLFTVFVFYAGLGIVSPWDLPSFTDTYFLLYVVFLYLVFSKIGSSFKNTLLFAMSILTAQFAAKYFFPMIQGYNMWLLFAFILGRFLGVFHPKASVELPLGGFRIFLGLLSFLIFILCFIPAPFIFD